MASGYLCSCPPADVVAVDRKEGKGKGRGGGGRGTLYVSGQSIIIIYNELGGGVKSDEIFFDSAVTSSCRRQVPEGGKKV